VGFEATTDLLRQAADKVDGRAGAVASADLAGPADRVAESMPGGAAATGQALELSGVWRTTLSARTADTHEYGKDLADSAATYQENDRTNETRFSGFAPRVVS
jgi:hypothetical protein